MNKDDSTYSRSFVGPSQHCGMSSTVAEFVCPDVFSIAVVGHENCGKTNVVMNLLMHRDLYGGAFEPEHIHIVCPSFDLDGRWRGMAKSLGIPKENVYSQVSDLDTRVDMVVPGPRRLIVIDGDSLSSPFMEQLVCRRFAHGISSIVTSRAFRNIPSPIIQNCTDLIVFGLGISEADLLYNYAGYEMEKDKFLGMLEEATKERHSCMIIDRRAPLEKRFLGADWMPLDVRRGDEAPTSNELSQ